MIAYIERPGWLNFLIGLGIGAAGQLLITVGLMQMAGWSGPVLTLLAPALVGINAAIVARNGSGAVGMAVGLVATNQVLPLVDPAFTTPPTIDLVVSLAAAAVGYAVGFGFMQTRAMPDFMRPPAPADLARVEAETRTMLRGIDPTAPGAFERATVLLRKVNEQVGMHSMWAGPRPTGAEQSPPSGLLELQAELIETARVAALNAGARRVTITSTGMGGGIDVQAVFGDAIAPDEDLPSTSLDVD